MGHSYSVSSPDEALSALSKELEGLKEGALEVLKITSAAHGTAKSDAAKVVLSLGATPTATAAQNLLLEQNGSAAHAEAQKYRALLDTISQSFAVELHAGVYPVLDMQQLATRARPAQSSTQSNSSSSSSSPSLLSYANLGLRALVEVASLYPTRGAQPEALIAAGSIVLGREPCRSYPGWGVDTPWPAPLSNDSEGKGSQHYDPEGSKTGWIVGRVSQEHGVLSWEGPREGMRELAIGEKLMVWPNHACIAGVNFGWYLVVDSDEADAEVVRDVWVRWRGW